MKSNLSIYIFIYLFTQPLLAQKTVVKQIDFKNQKIEVQLEDIDLLEIVHTNQNIVKISMNDYEENPSKLDVINTEKIISISSLKIMPLVHLETEKNCYEQPLFPSYTLIVPTKCDVSITFKNGNFSTNNFKGNLNLMLNTGDVVIDKFQGSVNVQLFSGNVEATIINTQAIVQSNHGKILTTFNTRTWQKTENSLIGTLGSKKNLLSVKSINANIMLNNSTTR
ncbi:hypothetical protein EGM88_11330 [Aureibaculum marinum]|uniref:Adhesin domain-containing protein n=1 Tax=Aureibaculum marinum TaxID=2487930 RepID=A0A3N4NW42_9FLAO|nr:DUF4097 family beta strand repeat-containing protein [Aureibaculum marinum]RPD95809.1 hypothetical protein EGM88_11330 [Aureibaculum marinum]